MCFASITNYIEFTINELQKIYKQLDQYLRNWSWSLAIRTKFRLEKYDGN